MADPDSMCSIAHWCTPVTRGPAERRRAQRRPGPARERSAAPLVRRDGAGAAADAAVVRTRARPAGSDLILRGQATSSEQPLYSDGSQQGPFLFRSFSLNCSGAGTAIIRGTRSISHSTTNPRDPLRKSVIGGVRKSALDTLPQGAYTSRVSYAALFDRSTAHIVRPPSIRQGLRGSQAEPRRAAAAAAVRHGAGHAAAAAGAARAVGPGRRRRHVRRQSIRSWGGIVGCLSVGRSVCLFLPKRSEA